jgi:uroporphyrinogen-III synthase
VSAPALHGRGIVVTRPREQAAALAGMIEANGGRALAFPTLEIGPPSDLHAAFAQADRLEEFDLIVFVSPNAVRRGLELIATRRGASAWPSRLRVAAVAQGSAQELAGRGFRDVIAPIEGHDSEALLALDALSRVAGRRVLIVRGEGGRALLGNTLRERGAQVEYLAAYRRGRPSADARPLREAWQRGEVDAVTVSSGEALTNLFGMLGAGEPAAGAAAADALRATPLFVPHARVAAHAQALGVSQTILAGPGDAQMLERLMAYFATKR